jgi:hypothetical protein
MMEQYNYTTVNIFKKAFEEGAAFEQKRKETESKEGGAKQHASQWSPYVNNEGTTVGIISTSPT